MYSNVEEDGSVRFPGATQLVRFSQMSTSFQSVIYTFQDVYIHVGNLCVGQLLAPIAINIMNKSQVEN